MIDKNSIAETLSILLPPQAEVEYDLEGDDFYASFCWLLNSDPKRPFKRSKRVHFVVTKEALDDFQNIGNKREARLLINLEAYISHKLAEFQPDHDAPEGASAPIEKWLIDSSLFLEDLDSAKGFTKRMF